MKRNSFKIVPVSDLPVDPTEDWTDENIVVDYIKREKEQDEDLCRQLLTFIHKKYPHLITEFKETL